MFSLLCMGNLLFLGLFVGFTQYLKSYLPRFWVDRIFWLPYIWLGFLLAILCLYFLPKIIPVIGKYAGWIIIGISLFLLQYTWQPIFFYASDHHTLPQEMQIAQKVAGFYQHGSLLIPGNDPVFTYCLYKQGIDGKYIRGEMFDPYYYLPGDPYANWHVHRDTVKHFFQKENISLLLFRLDQKNYKQLVEKEKGWFVYIGKIGEFEVYRIIQL